MTQKENEVFELVDLKTGKCWFQGTRDQCHGHFRADSMTGIMSAESADQYRKDKQREACNG